MLGERIATRPEDCPIGLWIRLCEDLQAPEAFIEENPETYAEIKLIWEQSAEGGLFPD